MRSCMGGGERLLSPTGDPPLAEATYTAVQPGIGVE